MHSRFGTRERLLGLVAVALVFRVLVMWACHGGGPPRFSGLEHLEIASDLACLVHSLFDGAAQACLEERLLVRVPGYSVFLTPVVFFFGKSHLAGVTYNALLDAVVALPLFFGIVRRVFDARTALWAGLVYALYPGLANNQLHLDYYALIHVFFFAAVYAFIVLTKAQGRAVWTALAWLSVACALGMVNDSKMLLLPLFFAGAYVLLRRNWKTAGLIVVGGYAAYALCMQPIGAYTRAVQGGAPLDTSFNFWWALGGNYSKIGDNPYLVSEDLPVISLETWRKATGQERYEDTPENREALSGLLKENIRRYLTEHPGLYARRVLRNLRETLLPQRTVVLAQLSPRVEAAIGAPPPAWPEALAREWQAGRPLRALEILGLGGLVLLFQYDPAAYGLALFYLAGLATMAARRRWRELFLIGLPVWYSALALSLLAVMSTYIFANYLTFIALAVVGLRSASGLVQRTSPPDG